MKDQHEKITGYRDLTQVEIGLMNEIKAEGKRLEALIDNVAHHLLSVHTLRHEMEPNCNPARWVNIARTDLQTGLMALTRAVARPTSF